MRANNFAIIATDLPMGQPETVCVMLNVPEPQAYIATLPDHLVWVAPYLRDQEDVARFMYSEAVAATGQERPYGLHAQRV